MERTATHDSRTCAGVSIPTCTEAAFAPLRQAGRDKHSCSRTATVLVSTVKEDVGQSHDKTFRIVVSMLREGFRLSENVIGGWENVIDKPGNRVLCSVSVRDVSCVRSCGSDICFVCSSVFRIRMCCHVLSCHVLSCTVMY